MNDCKCNNCCIDLYVLFHHDGGDITVRIQAEGIDGFDPAHQECVLAVRQTVEKHLVDPYRTEEE